MKCRFCGSIADQVLVDLGNQPPSNAYRTAEQLSQPEQTFPMKVFVCNECWLVQLPAHAASDKLFTQDYAYFSSVSSTWVAHAKQFAEEVFNRFDLGSKSLVVEVAANDGYLLQFFQQRGVNCLGIEPTESTAAVAIEKGIPTVMEFFGSDLAADIAADRGYAQLLIANNVLAHVPDLNDFVAGLAILLARDGVLTLEFPHLLNLVQGIQFDTIYHEHYSYLGFNTVQQLLATHGLIVFDVQRLSTHGGSLRVFAETRERQQFSISDSVFDMACQEDDLGMNGPAFYQGFQARVEQIRDGLLAFLDQVKTDGQSICGYGAAAKGNTLLNFAGVTPDSIPYVCDAAPSKQGRYMPGSQIPIVPPEQMLRSGPDKVLILPWNIADEIVDTYASKLPDATTFHVAVPEIKVC